MTIFNEIKLAKELIKFPSVTPVDAGVMNFLDKYLIIPLSSVLIVGNLISSWANFVSL